MPLRAIDERKTVPWEIVRAYAIYQPTIYRQGNSSVQIRREQAPTWQQKQKIRQ